MWGIVLRGIIVPFMICYISIMLKTIPRFIQNFGPQHLAGSQDFSSWWEMKQKRDEDGIPSQWIGTELLYGHFFYQSSFRKILETLGNLQILGKLWKMRFQNRKKLGEYGENINK